VREPDYRSLFHAAPAMTVVLDLELRVVDVNDAVVRLAQRPRPRLQGLPFLEAFPAHADVLASEGRARLQQSLERVRDTLQPDAAGVQRYDFPDETGALQPRYWSVTNHPVFEAGVLTFILQRWDDVTEFVLARQTEQPSLDRMTAEILLRSREIHDANLELHHARGLLESLNLELEARVATRTAELWDANEALRAEMEERELLEAQFRQSQKLEALGQLAGGVAHDFNNLLTVIIGCAEGLSAESLSPDAHDDLHELKHAAQRAAGLTGQLLGFSRRNARTPVVLELDEVVRGAEAMLRRLVGEHLAVHTELLAPGATVEADRGLVEQALMNLVVNARDAMPKGGVISLATRRAMLSARTPGALLSAPAGEYVVVSVSDTGDGMSAQTRERAFQPFFTTKEPGRGTGLGLAMVQGVLKQAGGDIVLQTAPGEGTTFHLYFPASRRRVGEAAAPQGPRLPPVAQGFVLLVEDEPQVRAIAQRALEQGGYTVLALAHPADALAWCEAHDTPVDLLLTDVVMPGMDGPTLAQRIRRLRPDLQALFMSGYTAGALPGTPGAFLSKPFTPAQLLDQVRGLLAPKLGRARGAAGK
jgi:signal transduction histidine kinase/CheY-like chemotaxis protein